MPAFNEAVSLSYVLTDTLKNLPKYFKDYEIIIVNDGSSDKTRYIANLFAKKNKHIKAVHHPTNKGFNQAMIDGIKISKKDYVCCMPSNGKILVDDMKKCYKVMDKYDLVLGNRGERFDYSPLRLILSFGCQIIYCVFFGIKYQDVHWVYFWKTKEIQKLQLDPQGGVFLLVESLVKFQKQGLKIGEAPAPYRSRMGGETKAVKFEVIWRTFKSIIRLWWCILTNKE